MNNIIIYGIIILCIIGIILVLVFYAGYKVLDIFLVGLFASGVYLINKNIADNENLDPEISNKIATDIDYDVIYNKIATDRYIAIKDNFHHTFVQKFKESDDKELDSEELDEHALKTLKTRKTFSTFLSITKNYLNNNGLSIENYFTTILPLFNYTEDNKDDLKKNIIKYVVFYDFPKYNKKGVKIPPNYKKLVDLYIKNNTYINNKNTAKHIERVVTTKSKLSDEVTLNFINDVQKKQITNNELNNIISNYIEYLKTQDIDVMTHFNENIKDKIQNKDLFNIIWKKAWMVSINRHPDSDPNSLGTGDR